MVVGLSNLPCLHPIAGIRLGSAPQHARKDSRNAITVMAIEPGGQCAAVFTRNAFSAAPVKIARAHLNQGPPRFCLINSGNANAGNGARGLEDALATCKVLAEHTGCSVTNVLPFSTGVIGEPLPVAWISDVIPTAVAALSENGWADAARAIMTTDTVPKGVSEKIQIQDHTLTVTGIAKGAGMIRPNMATMLAFVATDASVQGIPLQQCLHDAVDRSFNRISVDGDTSTNDACVLVATGQTNLHPIDAVDSDAYEVFRDAVTEVCTHLAQAIVRDGEGATKFVTIEVQDGKTDQECRQVAYTIANSPLVKTAFFASDPNWGRILAALGRAGLAGLDVSCVSIFLDDVCVVRDGERAAEYTEAKGRAVLSRDELKVRVELGRGRASSTVWTCDLSYDYVRINAEYRT